MNYEQRNAIVAIITNVIVTGYVSVRTWEIFSQLDGGSDGLLAQWAQLVLWAIPLSIVATIIASILFNIVWSILTKTPKPSFVVDERDKQISIVGLWVTMGGAGLGFILAVIGLALGWAALPALVVIYFGFALGDLCGNLTRVWHYRWGV